MKRITSSQRWLIKKLSKRVQVPEQFLPIVDNAMIVEGYCTRQAASQLITFLERLPMKPSPTPIPKIPTGCYSRYDRYSNYTRSGTLVHYKVSSTEDNPTHQNVVVLVDGYPLGEIRMIEAEWKREYILHCLSNDLVESMQRYGKATGICGYCFHSLTVEEKAHGLGRGCYQQMKAHELYLEQQAQRVYTTNTQRKDSPSMEYPGNLILLDQMVLLNLASRSSFTNCLVNLTVVAGYEYSLTLLRKRGLITTDNNLTPRGLKYVEMVKDTPLPIEVDRIVAQKEWADPR